MIAASPIREPIVLSTGVAAGQPPAGWLPLAHCPLLVLVGVTGVGKSTTLDALSELGVPLRPLPDRRALTDTLIIAAMQAADGLPPAPVTDRSARFAWTRRFREEYPGGMAQALTWLSLELEPAPRMLLFDGLRGENEVRFAVEGLPSARFVMLDAPDAVRVARLLGRRDAFDQVSLAPLADATRAGELFGEATGLFSPDDRAALTRMVESGEVDADSLRAKVRIVAEERRSYNPIATRAALAAAGSRRALVMDTVRSSPAQVAWAIAEWLTLPQDA